jgi:hypothetical protein
MCADVRILGVRFGTTIARTEKLSWGPTLQALKAVAVRNYHRKLSLNLRIQFARRHLLAKIWYLAQLIPPCRADVHRMETICTWFIWKGAMFKVPLTTLRRPKEEGGWSMDNVGTKCTALLYARMKYLGEDESTSTALLLGHWRVAGFSSNPPPRTRIPQSLRYCRQYAMDLAYLPRPGPTETRRAFRRCLTDTLESLAAAGAVPPTMRAERNAPTASWPNVWKNLHCRQLTGPVITDWYAVIHDIFPTRQRLHGIQRAESPLCERCGILDDIEHTLLRCSPGPVLWRWTRGLIAPILRWNASGIPDAWTWCPATPSGRRSAGQRSRGS